MVHQRFDEFIEVAFDEVGEVVERQLDAVVGDAVLREIVGADFFAAFARADLVFADGGVFGVFLGDLAFEQARAQHGQGARPVFYLRAFVGAAHDESAGLVNDLHGGVGGVHALTALAGRAADVDLDLVGLDLDVHLLGLGQHGDGGGAGVDAPLRLRGGHALDAVDAALVFEPLENIRAGHFKNDFLEPAEVGRTGIHRLDFPAHGFAVAAIHAVKVGGEEGGFRATRAGADFDDGIARVRRVGRHKVALDGEREAFVVGFEAGDILFGQLRHLGIGQFRGEQRAVFREVGSGLEIGVAGGDEFLQARVFAGKLLRALRIVESLRVAQGGFNFREAAGEFFDVGA